MELCPDIIEIRKQFPQLAETVYGRPLVYLDNAATSLRPVSVVEKWTEMSYRFNANIHRAVHFTANVATEEFEKSRNAVAEFIGASSAREVVFTSGTTQSVNLLAYSLGNSSFFNKGDEIIIAESEHHSDLVPWQQLAERKSLKIKVLPIKDDGTLEIEKLSDLLTEKVKLLCAAHVSNVLGIINPVKEICEICHRNGTLVLVDGAQAVAHLPVNVDEIGCDFYVFSGHKMFAAPGTGVLYGKKELLENLPPFLAGGEMIDTVNWDKTTFAAVPQRFEAGTQNISGVPTFIPAIETVKLLNNSKISGETEALKSYVFQSLSSDPDILLYGIPKDLSKKIPLFSISVKSAHHEDLALILDKMGIAVRSGQMCAEPLMRRFGVSGMLRASFAQYNTMDEAAYFVKSLRKAIDMLK